MILNVGFYMTTNVGIYMTTNLGIRMTVFFGGNGLSTSPNTTPTHRHLWAGLRSQRPPTQGRYGPNHEDMVKGKAQGEGEPRHSRFSLRRPLALGSRAITRYELHHQISAMLKFIRFHLTLCDFHMILCGLHMISHGFHSMLNEFDMY